VKLSPLLGIAILVVACGIPRLPDTSDDRCAVGFDLLESSACKGDGHGPNPEYLKQQLAEFKKQCNDAASLARIERIRETCLSGQQAAVRDMKEERRNIRAKYVAEVSALLLDPEYAPAVDRYRELKARRMMRDADDALAELAGLAKRHGIDPRYGRELDLW
jgi:hypothetical protein